MQPGDRVRLTDGREGVWTGTSGGPNGIRSPESPVTLDFALPEESLEVLFDGGDWEMVPIRRLEKA